MRRSAQGPAEVVQGVNAGSLPCPGNVIPAAKHVRVREEIRRLARELSPGTAIPSERELMERFEVSRATVRLAVQALVDDGLLEKVPARGTFVAEQRVESRLHLASFTEDMRRRGHVPSTVVLSIEQVSSRDYVDDFLTSAIAWKIERLRQADGRPIAVETSFLDASVTPQLHTLDLTESMYAHLSKEYGLAPDAAQQSVTAVLADARRSKQLQCRVGAPLLYFDRHSYAQGRPIERTLSWYRADRYALNVDLDAAMQRE